MMLNRCSLSIFIFTFFFKFFTAGNSAASSDQLTGPIIIVTLEHSHMSGQLGGGAVAATQLKTQVEFRQPEDVFFFPTSHQRGFFTPVG